MTSAVTIIAIVSAIIAAVFATLYLSRPEGRAALERIDAANQEIGRLRASLDNLSGRVLPVTPERILSFLTEGKGWRAGIDKDDPDKDINFQYGGSNYRIHTQRLPQVILSKGYNLSESDDIDWDALKQAAWMTTLDLVMVKMHIWADQKAYDLYVVSHEWDMNDFEKSLERNIDIIMDAEERLRTHYHEIMSTRNDLQAENVKEHEASEQPSTARRTLNS